MTEKTPEQLAAEVSAKQAAKAAAVQAKADKKAAKDAEKAAAKTAKDAAKVQAKADKVAAKEAAKSAAKQPAQNGVTRPKDATVCGKAWSIFDKLSEQTGKPALIGDAIKAGADIAEATVRTQYARWRKYHGITGRLEAPKADAPAAE